MRIDVVDQAMAKMNRKYFVPDDLVGEAGIDIALPIGFGQTISQPSTVHLMLDWLEAEPGSKVLDIGSGSGWTTALLSHILGPKGQVDAVERIPELVEMGRTNCEKAGVKNAKFYQAGKQYGLPAHSPYDRILVSASADQLPKSILSQLKIGGKLVIPVKHDILEITKTSEKNFDIIAHQGFIFVPLVQGD